jgi:hypothetical protein
MMIEDRERKSFVEVGQFEDGIGHQPCPSWELMHLLALVHPYKPQI